ncbi:hypothetical protein [Staphylococcus hominis]|uniref:hypothetical protein n=1 Tax=Staphylococcus hominis TaxID=1290 RepID=UPI003DA706E7
MLVLPVDALSDVLYSRLLMLMHCLMYLCFLSLKDSLVDVDALMMCLYLLNHSRLLMLMHCLMCLCFLSLKDLMSDLTHTC